MPAGGNTTMEVGTENSEDECLEKLLQEVNQLRRAGNNRCAAKAFKEGINLFTAALDLKPDATQLLTNRAFARIMTAEPASADEDCCLALALERRLPGAYRWRAAARRDCGWLAGAVEDMRMAARMAPTVDKKEVALKEVGKLEEWVAVLEESEAMKKAAEECLAREAKAPTLAAEAKAAFKRNLSQRRADMARKKTEEQEWRREQQAHRKQAEEDDMEHVRKQQAAKMLDKMRRSKNVEILSVDPKSGNFMNASGETTDIDSFIASLRLSMARGANGSSSSGSKVPRSSEPVASAVHAASQTPANLSHASSSADSSARHTMSAPAALHCGLFQKPNQAHASSAAQSASQSDGNEGDSDAEVTSTYQLSSADHESTLHKRNSGTATSNEPALPFYFARQKPCAAGESSPAPDSVKLPDQAAVDAVLQEIVQKERDARLELGLLTALAEADEQPPAASTGTQESAGTVPTEGADTLAAVEIEGRKGLKRSREQKHASDQLPRAQKQHIDATAGADYPSATDDPVDAPSGPPVGISPEASSGADGTADGRVSEADTQEYFAAETDGAAAPVEGTPAVAAPEIAAHESKEEPQPEHEAATDDKCWMTNPEQAETVPPTAASAEDSAVPEEAASEDAPWFGNLSKSQKKKAKRKAKLMSATAAGTASSPSDENPIPSSEADISAPTGAATEASTGNGDIGTCTPDSHLDDAPIPVSEAITGAPTGAATEASTGNGGLDTCTPSEAATDSPSGDGAPAADGGDSLNEPQSAGQEGSLLDSSKAPNGDADAAAAPAAGAAPEPAANSSESPANVANMADITKATCKVEATLQGAASSLEAQKAEQMSASTTVTKQGRSLFSAFGGWFGRAGKQGAASEASGSSTEVDIFSEATSGLSTPPDEGATSSPVSPSCQEGDYLGKDIYMKARAAHKRGNDQWARDKTKDCTHHYREAVVLCDQALVINPALGHAHLMKGACCLHLDRLQEAAEAYASALQHDLEFRNDAAAHAHVDHIVQAAHQEMAGKSPKKEVMALLDAAVRLSRSPEWACQALFSQGEACLCFGDEPSAIQIISNIISDDVLCAAFMRSSKITRAQRERVSTKIKDGGNELQKIKAFKDAKYLYTMSIAVHSANTAAYSNRAYMNLKLGLYGEAIEDATFVLDNTDDTKLRDKAHRRRAQACIELCQYKEAHADYQEIKQKRDQDITMIRSLEMTLAGAEQGAPLVVPKDYRWVKDLPRQKPVLDKNGEVMAGRYEALLDYVAEAGCTKEQLLQRLGISPKAADTSPATAKTDAPENSGAASPTCITSGPYASSSEGSSPANAQTSMPANGVPPPEERSTAGQSPPSGGGAAAGAGVPAAHEGPTAGQGPPSGGGAAERGVPSAHGGPTAGQGPPSSGGVAGADDGCGSRRPSLSYYTAEPGSPLSDACFGSPLSEQQEPTAFMPQNGGHRTSSGSSAAVPDPETSPIDTPSDVSIAGDSSDSDSQPSKAARSRPVPISLRQPNSGSSSDKVTRNGSGSFHSNGEGDSTVSAPASKAEPQECDPQSGLSDRSGGGLFGGELPSRVRVSPSSEASLSGPPKPALEGPPSVSGGSQGSSRWGARSDRVSWRQSSPAMPSGFLKQGLSEKGASRPEQARSPDEGSVREARPPPPAPMQRGFFGRSAPGNASRAEQQSEPQQQPVQRSDSCTSHHAGVYYGGKHIFKGAPGDFNLLQKAVRHIEAGEMALMTDNPLDAFEAADEAVRLVDQVVKLGRTPRDEIGDYIDKSYLLKSFVLHKCGRNNEAINCLTAALELNKDSHSCRESRACINILWARKFHLAAADLVKLCELTSPYQPRMPLSTRIITLAREEIAAAARRSAGKSKATAKKSSDGSDKPGSHSSTPTTAGSEPMAAERVLRERRQTYNKIIMQVIIWVAQKELHHMQQASSYFPGGARSPHMHARGPHPSAHAPRSFYGSGSSGRRFPGL